MAEPIANIEYQHRTSAWNATPIPLHSTGEVQAGRCATEEMKPNQTIEQAFVEAFVCKDRRDRALFELGSDRKRGGFFDRLCHRFDTVFDTAFVHAIPPPNSSADALLRFLQCEGAPDTCYVLSTDDALDGETLPLREALQRAVGIGMPSTLSCIPGKLAYFEAEQAVGPPPRFVLKRK